MLCVGLEVEEKVMSVVRERIPLAATQPVTDTRSVCLSLLLPVSQSTTHIMYIQTFMY